MGRRSNGFTLPELIAVLVISGMLLAVAVSRWDGGREIDELGYFESTLNALRLAERRAMADGCAVRISITAAGVAAEQRATHCSGAFSLPLAGTAGATPVGAPPPGLALSATPGVFYFDPGGGVRATPGGAVTNVTILVGVRQIQLSGATGHAAF